MSENGKKIYIVYMKGDCLRSPNTNQAQPQTLRHKQERNNAYERP